MKVLKQQIHPGQYEDAVGDDLVNLAVVLEDMATHERVLAFEEFNVATPELVIQVHTHTHTVSLPAQIVFIYIWRV